MPWGKVPLVPEAPEPNGKPKRVRDARRNNFSLGSTHHASDHMRSVCPKLPEDAKELAQQDAPNAYQKLRSMAERAYALAMADSDEELTEMLKKVGEPETLTTGEKMMRANLSEGKIRCLERAFLMWLRLFEHGVGRPTEVKKVTGEVRSIEVKFGAELPSVGLWGGTSAEPPAVEVHHESRPMGGLPGRQG